jgi:pimeloyl-ACP methyl ester carboxylesterase
MSVVIIDRNIIHYEVLGRGRPLILIHGWVGSWRYWIPVMQAASLSYRTYAIDLFGFGDTAKDRQRYSLEEQSQLVGKFLDQMGIGRVALLGHGLGGVVALMHTAQNPNIVDRVMAVSCPLEAEAVSARLKTGSPLGLAEWLLDRNTLTEPALVDAPKADSMALATSFEALSRMNGLQLMSQAPQTACLLVYGDKDPAVSPPDSDALAGLPQQAQAVSFAESGHFPMLDESSRFNRLLGDFLALASGETPRNLQLKEEWKRRVR